MYYMYYMYYMYVVDVFFLLLDCLDSFTKVEQLQESEQYFCPCCKKRQLSTKKLTIQRLPNVCGDIAAMIAQRKILVQKVVGHK